MGKRWDAKNDRKKQNRSRRRYLIVCEDSKSAVDYLESFRISEEFAEVVTEGGAGNTVSVVEKAISLKEEAEYNHKPYAHIWAVMDRDEHPVDRYRRAFDLGKLHNDLTVIWANESFELWYLLHFCYRDTEIGRAEINRELGAGERLNRKYEKFDKEVFALLEGRTQIAIKHATRLGRFNPSPMTNPSTNIHLLVGELIRLQAAANES